MSTLQSLHLHAVASILMITVADRDCCAHRQSLSPSTVPLSFFQHTFDVFFEHSP